MKSSLNYIVITVIYLLCMNLYFSFWYLGSEGMAVVWRHDEISFYHVWFSANIAGVIIMATIIIVRRLFKKWVLLKVGPVKPEFALQCMLAVFLFDSIVVSTCAFMAGLKLTSAISYASTAGFLSLNIYHLSLFIVIICLLNVNQRFGGIWKVFGYVFRQIYPPRDVEKGFMFLDLNDSTSMAEKLKSEVYSSFIRDCFAVLDKIVEKEDGIQVYQYVGDEAILYWDYKSDRLCFNAINLFHTFKQSLLDKSAYFLNKYGMVPTFKSAVHGGRVTQSEIGQKIIYTAFHGDVVNTTSRILGICRKQGTDLLISAAYFERLEKAKIRLYYERVDNVVLAGKTQRITVYKPIYPLSRQIAHFAQKQMTTKQS